MKKKMTIDEVLKYLSEKKEEIDNNTKKTLSCLNEMAFERKEFKKKIDENSIQLIQNWCLVRYCRFNKNIRTVNHWRSELRRCFLNVSRYKLKNNNSFEKRYKVIKEIWSDIELDSDFEVVDKTINNKFKIEKFPTNIIEYAKVLKDCVDESDDIIKVIAYGSIKDIDEYIKTL